MVFYIQIGTIRMGVSLIQTLSSGENQDLESYFLQSLLIALEFYLWDVIYSVYQDIGQKTKVHNILSNLENTEDIADEDKKESKIVENVWFHICSVKFYWKKTKDLIIEKV